MSGVLEADPLLVWGLFTRGLGVVFLISFFSLGIQIAEFAGADSAIPMSARFDKLAKDFPTWRRFLYFPTLLWLNASTGMLRALTVVGFCAAAALVYGGPWSQAALLVCYVCYLSLDLTMGLIFPWDSLLFECTILGLFLPVTHSLPVLESVAAPAPALTWAYRILLFRLMFGFGKQKFVGSRREDLAYLKGFLVSQPLPSPLGWYMQKLPGWFLKGGVLFMFLVEIPVPFFAFFPGWLSVICAVTTAFLMVGIQATGSYGYFSIATVVLCIVLFDNTTPGALELTAMFDAGAPIGTNAFILLHTLSACVAFLFNSWASQSWHLWAFWYQFPKIFQIPVHFFRYLHPFRWLHPFGVFPPNNWPSAKMSLLFECTWDRDKWHEMEFEYSPSNARSRPRFVSPHHPRADQAVIYDTMGLNPTSLITGHLSGWDPYAFGSRAPSVGACQYLLHGGKTNLLKCDELKRRSDPPVAMRVSTIMLEPVGLEEHRKNGTWWKRTYVGPHVPTQEKDPLFFEYAIADPELWHFDSIFWRRRSRLRPLMDRALAGDDPMALAVLDGDGIISPEDVDLFWSDFLPLLGGDVRSTFDTLPDTVEAVKARFDPRTQRALYKLLQRFSLFLVVRLEPHYLYKWTSPDIPVKTYFHLWMLAQYIIGNGKEAYLAAYREPLSVVKHVPELTTQNGLYAQSVFRFDEMTFEAQKLRLITAYVYPHDAKQKAELAEKTRGWDLEGLKPGERLFINIGRTVSGFFNVLPDIRDGFKGPRFERGSPERYPVFHELPTGEVVVKEYG